MNLYFGNLVKEARIVYHNIMDTIDRYGGLSVADIYDRYQMCMAWTEDGLWYEPTSIDNRRMIYDAKLVIKPITDWYTGEICDVDAQIVFPEPKLLD